MCGVVVLEDPPETPTGAAMGPSHTTVIGGGLSLGVSQSAGDCIGSLINSGPKRLESCLQRPFPVALPGRLSTPIPQRFAWSCGPHLEAFLEGPQFTALQWHFYACQEPEPLCNPGPPPCLQIQMWLKSWLGGFAL